MLWNIGTETTPVIQFRGTWAEAVAEAYRLTEVLGVPCYVLGAIGGVG